MPFKQMRKTQIAVDGAKRHLRGKALGQVHGPDVMTISQETLGQPTAAGGMGSVRGEAAVAAGLVKWQRARSNRIDS